MQKSLKPQLISTRALTLPESQEDEDIPSLVRAASGICPWKGGYLIIQDDVNALVFHEPLHFQNHSILLPRGKGKRRQFSEAEGNKREKMDLEAALILPDGRFLAFSSGSSKERQSLVLMGPDEKPELIHAAPFYESLQSNDAFSGGELNLEGVLMKDDGLLLFQRGNGESSDAQNRVGRLSRDAFLTWLLKEGPLPALLEIKTYELGEMKGVPLGFSDACLLPDGRVVFLATAEDSPDTYRDGEVMGSALGLLSSQSPESFPILDEKLGLSPQKWEGILWEKTDAEGLDHFLLVSDDDDPEAPSLLGRLSVRLPKA